MLNKSTSSATCIYRQLGVLPTIVIAVILFGQATYGEIPGWSTQGKANETNFVDPVPDIIVATSKLGPWPYEEGTRPEHGEVDAPAKVMVEYMEILNKYQLSDTSGNTQNISEDDRIQLHGLFTKMSIGQQDYQSVRFVKVVPPRTIVMNETLLSHLKSEKMYTLWIDGQLIQNKELIKYKADDLTLQKMDFISGKDGLNSILTVHVSLLSKAVSEKESKGTDLTKPDQLVHFIRKWSM